MYKLKTIADFLGDRVIYRNLSPADPSLPRLANIRIPRKTEPSYANIVYKFLQAAQSQRGLPPLEQLLFIGDTYMNDGTAAKNLGRYLPLHGFIGADKMNEQKSVMVELSLFMANRWQALEDFLVWLQDKDIEFNDRTALLIDLDKTTLGARGRNDKLIDQARVTAVRLTVEELLGGADAFDEDAFRAVYDRLNQLKYHYFTVDNQDYLAYISLMVIGQIYPPEKLWADLENGSLTEFSQFITLCDARHKQMSKGLLTAHSEVTSNMAKNDPTPFKSFRLREYYSTIALMNILPNNAPLADVLAGEIVITGEVADVATQLAAQGVLTFGISDKPDEASIPTTEAAADGAVPLHHVTMKVVGGL